MLATLSLPIPEKGGAMPDFLDEVKWELDWLLTTQADDGRCRSRSRRPRSRTSSCRSRTDRGATTPAPAGGDRRLRGGAGAGLANLPPFDAALADTYLEKARAAWAYVKMHNASVKPDLSMFSTGGYDANQFGPRQSRLGGGGAVGDDRRGGVPDGVRDIDGAADHPGQLRLRQRPPLGTFTYLLSMRTGRDQTQVDTLTASAIASANALAARADAAAFGRAINGYWWGSNGAVARTSMNLFIGGLLSPADAGRFQDAIAMQLDHLLGRNIYDRTQVTGIGYHPPIRPHHRPSVSDTTANPWPGLLVGGAQPERHAAGRTPPTTPRSTRSRSTGTPR